MNIAVIAKTRLPIIEPFRGGLEAFTHMVCTEYIHAGHDITVYAHPGSDPALHPVSFHAESYRDKHDYSVYEQDEYTAILKDIEQKGFDVVHDNSTHELPIIWGATAAIPVITTLHTPPLNARTQAMTKAVEQYSDSQNLHIVAVSESFRKTWQPYVKNDITVIHNGVNLKQWPLVRTSQEYLLWFGRIVEPKGLDIALDAAHAAGIPLHFAGPLDDTVYYEQSIKPRLKQADKYLGHLEQSEILEAMRGAAAMVNSVRWEEPFGLTTIEAMAAGVPIAGFDRGAFKELISPLSGVVASDMSVKALADAIQLAKELDSRQVRKQAERFSVEQLSKDYLNYFQSLT